MIDGRRGMMDKMDRILCCRFLVSVGEVKLSTKVFSLAFGKERFGSYKELGYKWLRYPSR